jgi:hypothetical protein
LINLTGKIAIFKCLPYLPAGQAGSKKEVYCFYEIIDAMMRVPTHHLFRCVEITAPGGAGIKRALM